MRDGMLEVFSSGGVGDSLIVGLKIQKELARCGKGPEDVVWKHYEKHLCHVNPISDVMQHFARQTECKIEDKPEVMAQEACGAVGGIYLDTRVPTLSYPYLDKPLRSASIKSAGSTKYLCVHLVAGRLNDNTCRKVSGQALQTLLDNFPDKKMVLLAPTKVDVDLPLDRVVNLTGQTKTITEAFDIINSCSLFVGQDGVLAYYAMMIQKPTIVAYHLPNLPGHYWNAKWGFHSLLFVGAGNDFNTIPDHPKVSQLFEHVRKRDEGRRLTP